MVGQVEPKDRRHRKKDTIEEAGAKKEGGYYGWVFLASRRLSISKLLSLEGACTHPVYMLKRRYLRGCKPLGRRINSPVDYTTIGPGASPARQRPTAAFISCKIVSWSNSNACRRTRESISVHSTSRSIPPIHHSPSLHLYEEMK